MKAPTWGRMDYGAWFDSPDVQLMTWKERTLCGDLLKFQWIHGWIPANPSKAARMIGVLGDAEFAEFEVLFAAVVGMFVDVGSGRLIDPCLKVEYDKRLRFLLNAHRPAIPVHVRQEVLSSGCCAVCYSTDRLEVDHVVPWSRGGTHSRLNLRALCRPCNRDKGAKLDSEWLQ